MTESLGQLRVAACVIPGIGHTGLWCENVPSLNYSAMEKKKVAMQQGKYRAIVHNQPLRLRRTHFHQGQMFWLAVDCANWGCKVRVWRGGQDMAGAEPRQTFSSVSLTRGSRIPN